MSIIAKLDDPAVWEAFAGYKLENRRPSDPKALDLRRFIDQREYLEAVEQIRRGEFCALPVKKQIAKFNSEKKRVVYVYPREVCYVLKLMTFLLIREYDHIFEKNLYSFRAQRGVREALAFLTGSKGISGQYAYKADVSNYFNSVDIPLLLPMLKETLAQDPELYLFLERMLTDSRVLWNGSVIREEKGIMAGCPAAAFLANVYLSGIDRYFYQRGIPYARYSDDIIFFAPTAQEREELVETLHWELEKLHLSINPAKEQRAAPHEAWEFLGICYRDGKIDISPASAAKLKGKMHRKAAALLRWKRRKNLDNRKAAKAFVRVFNRRLYDNPVDTELTWTRWFFPLINTADTLYELDHYMQECIRYLATEKRTKRRYDFRYEDLKALGYRSLVNEYYRVKKATALGQGGAKQEE